MDDCLWKDFLSFWCSHLKQLKKLAMKLFDKLKNKSQKTENPKAITGREIKRSGSSRQVTFRNRTRKGE
jgi:hypothetical protein